MTTQIHYDLLRESRVKDRDDLVVGHRYLECQVPFDNPYTRGVDPYCVERIVLEKAFLSSNDIYVIGREHKFRDREALERMLEDEELNAKQWLFRTDQEDPHADIRGYSTWLKFEDYGVDPRWDPLTFLLDIDALAEQNIEVIRTTSVPFIMSETLRRDRAWESQTFFN